MMKCLLCDAAAELVRDTRDLPYTSQGETTLIPGVTGDFCPACEELVLDRAESSRVSAAMLEFNKQVSTSIVDRPLRIREVVKEGPADERVR